MTSVALDIFHMPEVTYEDERFNCFLLCVDRHSGWMIARPTTEEGLTGKKAATLMLDSSWGEMGIPSIITSDQGPQFVSAWWKQMCSRLGVRQAYSQAYRHQANGRAEVAGRVVQDLLRKMHTQNAINWVEALPRVLRIQHDSRDPILGMSPYQAIFGRPRALAALPYDIVMEAQDPQEYFEHMDFLDQTIAEKLNIEHHKIAESINAHRRSKKPFAVGDWVWHLKPKPVGGIKMSTYWDGPCRVLARVGESSYQLKDTFGKIIDAHVTGLKPYVFEVLENPISTLEIPPLPYLQHNRMKEKGSGMMTKDMFICHDHLSYFFCASVNYESTLYLWGPLEGCLVLTPHTVSSLRHHLHRNWSIANEVAALPSQEIITTER